MLTLKKYDQLAKMREAIARGFISDDILDAFNRVNRAIVLSGNVGLSDEELQKFDVPGGVYTLLKAGIQEGNLGYNSAGRVIHVGGDSTAEEVEAEWLERNPPTTSDPAVETQLAGDDPDSDPDLAKWDDDGGAPCGCGGVSFRD